MLALLSSTLHLGTDTLMSALILLGKATVILSVAFGATRVMQHTTAVSRHLVWFSALAVVLIIPLLIAVSPVRMPILPSSWAAAGRSAGFDQSNMIDAPNEEHTPLTPVGTSPRLVDDVAPVLSEVGVPVDPLDAARSSRTAWSTLPPVGVLLLSIWAVLALGFTGWLLVGMWTVHRIVRRADLLDSDAWRAMLYEIADRLSLDALPTLMVSDDVAMPFACGLRTSIVVLPRDSGAWTSEQRAAVLLHEMAHIKRRDIVGHTVGRFACALYWFHPLVWTAAKKLRAESERACDDMALSCGARASDYAEHLLNIVVRVKTNTTPPMAMAMATRKEFEGRMLAILDPALRRATPSRRQSASLVSAVVVVALAISLAVPATGEAVQRTSLPISTPAELPARPAAVAPTATVSVTQSAAQSVSQRAQTDGGVWADPDNALPQPAVLVEDGMKALVRSAIQLGIGAAAEAVRGVRTASDSSERPALLAKILNSEQSAELRRVAAWGLNDFASESVAVQALSNALARDTSAAVREMSAWSLQSAPRAPKVSASLIAAIRGDKSPLVRLTAVWSLASVGEGQDTTTINSLAMALKDTDSRVRDMAAWALGSIPSQSAPSPLLAATQDADRGVRIAAAWALYQIGDAAAVNAIDQALREEQVKELQLAQVRALTSLGEPAIPFIKRLLEDPNPEIKSLAVNALAGMRGNRPWPWPRPHPRPFP